MREPVINSNDTPKIHVGDPSVDYLALYFEDINLSIPPQLWGLLSSLYTRVPTPDKNSQCDKAFLNQDITTWDP